MDESPDECEDVDLKDIMLRLIHADLMDIVEVGPRGDAYITAQLSTKGRHCADVLLLLHDRREFFDNQRQATVASGLMKALRMQERSA